MKVFEEEKEILKKNIAQLQNKIKELDHENNLLAEKLVGQEDLKSEIYKLSE